MLAIVRAADFRVSVRCAIDGRCEELTLVSAGTRVCRVADACEHAERQAEPEIGAAIQARVFVHAFWLRRDTAGVLSRATDVVLK